MLSFARKRPFGYTAFMDVTAWTAVATVVSALATVVLALITGYYAWQTRRIIEEMRKGREVTRRTVDEMVAARELALMPLLTCRLVVDHERAKKADDYIGPNALAVVGGYTDLVLANVGSAPALDVTAHVIGDPHDRGRLRVSRLDLRVGILGLGLAEDRRHRLSGGYEDDAARRDVVDLTFLPTTTTKRLNYPAATDPLYPAVVVTASYANAYGRRFVTCTTFDLGREIEEKLAWIERASSTELLTNAAGGLAPVPEEAVP